MKNAENRHFCTKSDLKVLYPLVMFLKHMLRIVEVHSNVLVLISQVAALNWSDTIYPNLGYPVKHSENRHFCTKSYLKVLYPLVMFLKLMLRIVEVYSNVLVLISQVAALNCSDTINPNVGCPRQKRRKSTFLHENWSEVLYPLVMSLKLMLRIVEVSSNVLVLISQVAGLNWSDTIYLNLGYPRKKRRKSTLLHEGWSESTLTISGVPETYVENSWGL